MENMKSLYVDKKLHKRFKRYAVEKEKDMKKLLSQILIEKMESDPIE
jgi:hypothetical protein